MRGASGVAIIGNFPRIPVRPADFLVNIMHFRLRVPSGVAKRGIRKDPGHFLAKYKAFSAARCVWCRTIRLFYRSGAFFR